MTLYEFINKQDFMDAALILNKQGSLIEVYSPLPEEELIERLEVKTPWITRGAIGGAIFGALFGFFLQFLPNVYGYSHNIGGRPLNSWPAFLLVTFEMGVLMCAFSIVGSFLLSNKYPRFYRVIFGIDSYNQNRHEHFFILTKKEDTDVKAHKSHRIADAS